MLRFSSNISDCFRNLIKIATFVKSRKMLRIRTNSAIEKKSRGNPLFDILAKRYV